MDIFFEEHQQLLRLLIKHNVSFMLIGGYAVIYYGYERTTGDMDIWLKLGEGNKKNLIAALSEFGISDEDITQLKQMDFTKPLPVFYIGVSPRRVDFVTLISNVQFEEAFEEVNYSMIHDIQIPVIHYNHLLKSKLQTGRAKDAADIEELERINKYRNK